MSGDAPREDDADAFWKQNPKESTEEAEIGLLGAALADDTGAAAKDLFGVSPDDFSSPHCAAIARAIAASMNGAPAPDGIAVAMALRASGEMSALTIVKDQLLNWHTGANSALYAGRIRYFANRRREARIRQRLGAARGADEQDRIRRELEDFEAIEREEGQTTPVAASSWDMAALRNEPPEPEARQFVHRLFVRPSVNIIFAPAQSGKSWAIKGLCVDAVTGGGKFLGCEDLDIFPLRDDFKTDPPPQERVLWVFGNEDTKARVRRRTENLLQGRELPHGRFVIATPPGALSLHLEEGWRWLLEQIELHQPSILVFDTLTSLCGHTLDINDNFEVARFMNRVNALRDQKQLVVFIIHHSKKGTDDPKKTRGEKADSMIGASALRSLADGVLNMAAKDGNTQDITVVSIKAKDIPNPIPSFRVCLENPSARFRVLEDDEAAPEREAVATKTGGRPAKFSADAVLALRPRFEAGIAWQSSIICDALEIGTSTWGARREDVLNDLIRRGCCLVDGNLRWPLG